MHERQKTIHGHQALESNFNRAIMHEKDKERLQKELQEAKSRLENMYALEDKELIKRTEERISFLTDKLLEYDDVENYEYSTSSSILVPKNI